MSAFDELFPKLASASHRITSPRSESYNCIAWAVGDDENWWWPFGRTRKVHWPPGVPREESVPAFRDAFKSLGYVECEQDLLEPGFEKIALFTDGDAIPLHTARQLATGQWTSKIGVLEDIEHSLRDLEGLEYGQVNLLMKRPISAKSPKLVIALIGGIGSGKSSVAAEFVKFGATVVSGDHLGHSALRQPDIRARVVERFGNGIVNVDGEIDRRALAAIVFSEVGKLRELEDIVFPFIEEGLRKQVAAAQRDSASKFVIIDAAVMLEAGWNSICDKIVYVDAPMGQRLARLAAQRGWTEEEVKSRSRAQLPTEEKAARANAAIDNSGPLTALAPQVAHLLTSWGIPVAIQGGLGDNG